MENRKDKAAEKKRAGRERKGASAKERKAAKASADSGPKYETLVIESGSYDTTLNKTYMRRKPWRAENPKHIMSFMPGSVEQIKVGVGDSVKEGEPLLIFRAMKMSNSILSPVSGKIRAINVKTGENVPKNTLMIEIK